MAEPRRQLARREALAFRLLLPLVAVSLVVGAVTLVVIEYTLSSDLTAVLDARLRRQAAAVAVWFRAGEHQDRATAGRTDQRSQRLATRLAAVTSARITIIEADDTIAGDSHRSTLIGTRIGLAPEVQAARDKSLGRAQRWFEGRDTYFLAVPVEEGRVVRLAVSTADNIATQRRARNRLLVGSSIGFLAVLVLSWFVVRAVVQPLQAMTETAEALAGGDYNARPPATVATAKGEVGVLANAFTHLAGEVQARFAEVQGERDLVRAVLASLVESVIVLDRDQRVALINAAGRRLLGDEIRNGEPLPPQLAAVTGRMHSEGEEIQLGDRALRATALPLAGDGGTVLVLYDITRMRALEGQSREFLASAAHELRTPVTAISGYAETLLSMPNADEATRQEFLSIIHRNALRIAHLVSDLLVLEGLGARAERVAARSPIALAPVVADAIKANRVVFANATFECIVADDLVALGDRDGMDHVVQNLLDNAAKYGGNAPIEIRGELRDGHVVLSVRDRGPGIAPQHLARIFDRFYRVDPGRSRDQGGSGLGLAIARSQAEAMGGTLTVSSIVGEGTTFELALDRADRPLSS